LSNLDEDVQESETLTEVIWWARGFASIATGSSPLQAR
jgi:hypothetical protein